MNGRAWSSGEIDFMLKNPHLSAKKLSEMFKRTEAAVRHKRWELGADYESAMPTPERLTESEKLSRIYLMCTRLGVKIQEEAE